MEGVCLEGGIEIAVIVGVILLGVGWKAVGGGCYQSRPIQQQQEIWAAAYRSMDGKESACVASAVHLHGHVCVSVVILHIQKVRRTDRPAYCAALAGGGESMFKCQHKERKEKKKNQARKADIQNRMN